MEHTTGHAGEISYQLQELKSGSFIYEIAGALPADACADMIQRFENNPQQQYRGRIGQQQLNAEQVKRSTDLRISGREDWRDVDQGLYLSLRTALAELSQLHPFFRANSFRDIGYNMQRTRPGEFYHWHVDGGPGEFSQRQLVALWYLNDTTGPGGETEFLFQSLKVKPETGKLLLFPPFWTHVHRGVELQRGVKYIATTWVSFVPEGQDTKVACQP